ncbi:auxin-responsive protein IAA13-like isoform X2 [Actinidia eriantha]|uniref:auxin-responsive protein IAA13-like isoform X2 n=1 Tax=Actinidia eriantha TaxID=165200 RepID=UPI00258BB4E8|nr:auxin-responsive protein IAA13-like isoform X2 [Actinidia eriantha]
MEADLGLLRPSGGDGGGDGASSGGSASGSISMVPKEDNLVVTSEESSSYPEESGLELGLGLSLGGGGGGGRCRSTVWGPYARILTAKDLPSMGLKSSSDHKSPSSLSSSSSSSSSSMTKANFSSGTKRAADSGFSQVVGWPPIRASRMNSLANQSKSPPRDELHSRFERSKTKNGVIDLTNSGCDKNCNNLERKGQPKTSLFVKVNMDGFPIGRKVDLSAHGCYETLAKTLEDMFCKPTTMTVARGMEEHDVMTEATGFSKLLDGSSEFVLTYEDKEGDWMLVGDVPWGMFLNSAKRLRIMRTTEAKGLGPRFQERSGRQSKHI